MGVEPLILVSSNPNKGIEAERILGVSLLRVSISLPEIQAPTVEDITRYKREVARTKGYGRLVVEDVSLGFDELGNFPGPYVRWLLEAAGGQGLGAIAYALLNRSAKAQCCVAYWDGETPHIFLGDCKGHWREWNEVKWPHGVDYGGVAVSDLNKDGHVDVVFARFGPDADFL